MIIYYLSDSVTLISTLLLTYLLTQTKEEVNAFARVHLFVCLSAGLLKNVCMDLDEMLRDDRCCDMDELINLWAWSGLQSGCQNRIAFSDIVCTATRNFITSGKFHVRYCAPVTAAMRGFKMVLFTASRGNNFVGGTCAPPSVLLVRLFILFFNPTWKYDNCIISCDISLASGELHQTCGRVVLGTWPKMVIGCR